jgi:hypothetical protein
MFFEIDRRNGGRPLSQLVRQGVFCVLLSLLPPVMACENGQPSSDADNDAGGQDADDEGDASDADEGGHDADDQAQVCPVTGYSPCGGSLLGAWSFLDLCPEDPEAAAALCESPFDDRPECVGSGNLSICDSTKTGTLDFRADGTILFEDEIVMIATWYFTDRCLEAVRTESTPTERCESISNEHLRCEYQPDRCVCVSDPMPEHDEGSGTYVVSDNELVIGDDPPATYCIDGDRLTMDYYLFHPVSWRYWVLERE